MSAISRLSVNLNKIALLRDSRHTNVPDILHFARLAREGGADGITVHPRPDERHIRRRDVFALAELMQPWRPGFELNIEGYPDARLLEIVQAVRPEQCTLVPDAPDAFTSDSGWQLERAEAAFVADAVRQLQHSCGRVILFIDPDPAVAPRVAATGAAGIEIYTGAYAAASGTAQQELLTACAETARAAAGLLVNIGHDLNLHKTCRRWLRLCRTCMKPRSGMS